MTVLRWRWRTRVVVLAVVILGTVARPGVLAAPNWWRSLAYIGSSGDCTAVAVRPKILATAAHCVDWPTATLDVYRRDGITSRKSQAMVVWKSYYSALSTDLALLTVDKAWPATVPLAGQLPVRGETLYTAGYSVGLATWTSELLSYGLYYYIDDDQWIVLYQGMTGPGSSGSPIVNTKGELVAVHTLGFKGLRGLGLGIEGGSPVGYVGYALRDYERHGIQHGWWDAPSDDTSDKKRQSYPILVAGTSRP